MDITRRGFLKGAGVLGAVAVLDLANPISKKVFAAFLQEKQPEIVEATKDVLSISPYQLQIKMDGEYKSVGNLVSVNWDGPKVELIDVSTDLDEGWKEFMPPDYIDPGEIIFELAEMNQQMPFSDMLTDCSLEKYKLIMGGVSFEFEAYVASFSTALSGDHIMTSEIILALSGEVFCTMEEGL